MKKTYWAFNYPELLNGDERLRIVTDEHPTSPRSYDNLGKMVTWHSNYTLGDEQVDYEQFLVNLADEVTDSADRAPYMEKKFNPFKQVQGTDGLWYNMDDGGTIISTVDREPGHETKEDAVDDLEELKEYFIVDDWREDMTNSKLLEMVKGKGVVILPLFLYDHSGITMNTTGFSCGWDSGQVGWIYVTPEKLGELCLASHTTEEIEKMLRGEVETYDAYLTGSVYGFQFEVRSHCDHCGHEEWRVETGCWGFYGDDMEKSGLMGEIPERFATMIRKGEVIANEN